MTLVRFQGKPFNVTVIQFYTSTTKAKEDEVEWSYEDLIELTPKKMSFFIIGGWNAKVGSQEIPGVTGKFDLGVQNEANRVFSREHTGHRKYPLPTTEETTLHMDISRWLILKSG